MRQDVQCNLIMHYISDLISGDGMSLCEPFPFFPDQCKYMSFLDLDHFIQGKR